MQVAGVSQVNGMVQQTPDEFFVNGAQGQLTRMPGGPVQAGGGSYELQKYQSELTALNVQNRRKLAEGQGDRSALIQLQGSGPMAQPGFATALSPSHSRASGPSPTPNEQTKRETPNMAQSSLPQSPVPDQNRSSPGPAFDVGQLPPGSVGPPYYPQMAGAMMRPPSSNPGFNLQAQQQNLEMLAQQNGGRLPPGVWPQQMVPQQNQPQRPPQAGTPQQRANAMPPPPAPPTAGEQGKAQSPSPSQQNTQPPTLAQTTKSTAKAKKDSKDARKVCPTLLPPS